MIELQPLIVPPPKPCKKPRFLCWLGLIVFLGAALLIAVLLLCPQYVARYTGYPMQSGADEQKIADLETRIRAVETRLAEIDAQPATASETKTEANAPVTSTDIARLQSDVVNLSAAFSALQTEVKQAGAATAQSRQAAETSLAEAIAFIQLRESVTSGRSYVAELGAMRDAAKTDTGFTEPLSQLDAYAAQGVPTMAMLQEDLVAAESPASQAIDKNGAHSWWERILVELKGLVSVRRLHGKGADGDFTAMEEALARGDMAAALDAMKNLPPEAQDAMGEWRVKVETRAKADAVLQSMAARFTAHANSGAGAP